MITTLEILIVLVMTAATVVSRVPVLILVGKITLPDGLTRALRYVPPAVLTAIIVPEALVPGGTLNLSPTSPYLVAWLVSIVVAWRTRNLLLTIILGMVAFLLVRALTGGFA